MRSLLSKRNSDDKTDSLYIERILNGREKAPEELWPTLFFTSDIAIMGLGLSFSEIDLWWLLAYRASFFLRDSPCEVKKNSIIYFDVFKITEGEDRQAVKNRLKGSAKAIALDGLDVTYLPIVCDVYGDGYFEVLETLEKIEDWGDIE